MTEIPSSEPTKIQAGVTVKWKRTFTDYPAPTWILKYSLVKPDNQITITASASGTDHLVSIDKATSAGYTAGIYHWQAYVDNGTDRWKVDEGTFEILPDFETQTTGFDNRTLAAKMVEGLEALFTGKITRNDFDILSYEINSAIGRKVQRMSLADLRAEYTKWKADLKAEQAAERMANGLGTGRKIHTRFVSR